MIKRKMRFLIFLCLLIGCDRNEIVTETLIVDKITKTKFQEDYIEFSKPDGSPTRYWMKGPRYKNTPYQIGDKLEITHKKYYNNSNINVIRIQ